MTATTPVRVDNETYAALKEQADARHVTVGQVVSELWRAERERRFWADVDAAYVAMQANPAVWAEELALREELDGTLMDGLHDE